MKLLAKIISRVFDPIIEIPLLLALSVWYAFVNGLAWKFLIVLLFVDAVLPSAFFLYLLKKHEISNWDISKRAQRIPFYGFTMLAHLAGVGLAMLTGRMVETQILLVFWILGMIFFGITTVWKISVHAGVNSALATFMVYLGGVSWVWLYLILIPVGWSRVVLGHHKLDEYIVGAVLAAVGMWVGFGFFGIV